MGRKRGFWCKLTVLVLALVVIMPTALSCSDKEENINTLSPTPTMTGNEGELPILSIGDKWLIRVAIKDMEYKIAMEVTRDDATNGKNCYVVKVSAPSPTVEWLKDESSILMYDKDTMFITKMQEAGMHRDTPYTQTVSFSYQFSGDPPYPLEVGRELKVVETYTNTQTPAIGDPFSETLTRTYIRKIENMEQITVPAGTFRAFKIVQYDEDGAPLTTEWRADETKHIPVKQIDHETGDIRELLSYSVARQ
jgi:hypothetical protein